MKKAWKLLTTEWSREARLTAVGKAVFPALLKKLIPNLSASWAVGGFRESGLYPINREIPKKKSVDRSPPKSADANIQHLRRAISSVISPNPSPDTIATQKNNKQRRRRVQAKVGEILTSSDSMTRLQGEEEARKNKKKTPKRRILQSDTEEGEGARKNKKKAPERRILESDTESEDSKGEVPHSSQNYAREEVIDHTEEQNSMKGVSVIEFKEIKKNDWLLVICGEKKYLGQVQGKEKDGNMEIRFIRFQRTVQNLGKVFAEAPYKDISTIQFIQVLGRVAPPIPSRRGSALIFEVNGHLW